MSTVPRSTTGEISIFITPRALITVRKDDFDIDTLIAHWDLNADLTNTTNYVSVLTYGLLDAVVDGHYAAIEQLDDAIDDLQTLPLPNPHRTRYSPPRLRPGRQPRCPPPRRGPDAGELVSRLMRADSHLLDDTLGPYWHDVYDHAQRTTETVDAARDRVDRIADTQRNEQDAQLNEITKKLAAWAAIIAVPTAVTGFYGQNVPYPGFGHHAGFLTSCFVMIILAGGLYWLLRRNNWL